MSSGVRTTANMTEGIKKNWHKIICQREAFYCDCRLKGYSSLSITYRLFIPFKIQLNCNCKNLNPAVYKQKAVNGDFSRLWKAVAALLYWLGLAVGPSFNFANTAAILIHILTLSNAQVQLWRQHERKTGSGWCRGPKNGQPEAFPLSIPHTCQHYRIFRLQFFPFFWGDIWGHKMWRSPVRGQRCIWVFSTINWK